MLVGVNRSPRRVPRPGLGARYPGQGCASIIGLLSEVFVVMRPLDLPACPFFGPTDEGQQQPTRVLPADYETQPLKYLPPKVVLSEAELELAAQYEQHNFSGGFVTSQIAYFRRGPSAEAHKRRRDKFARLKAEADRRRLILPEALVGLVESDDYVSRLRHHSIGMQLPDDLVPLPSDPEYTFFLIFGEEQGCAYWHVLLAPDGGHVMAFSEHPFGVRNIYPGGYVPDLASIKVYRCADSFAQWIVNFSAETIEQDHHYEQFLREQPGI
jgi:hypothetical protein